MTQLNGNEIRVLRACADNAIDAAGGDFGFTDELEVRGNPELNPHQVAGYLGDLKTKGAIAIDGHPEPGIGAQVTLCAEAWRFLVARFGGDYACYAEDADEAGVTFEER